MQNKSRRQFLFSGLFAVLAAPFVVKKAQAKMSLPTERYIEKQLKAQRDFMKQINRLHQLTQETKTLIAQLK